MPKTKKRKTKKQTRTVQVRFVATPEEKERWERAAEEERDSYFSSWCRRQLNLAADRALGEP